MTLYINACLREESRTERLARAYLAHISDVTELNVYDQPLVPLDRKRLAHRESLIAGGKWHDPMFDYAHQFADADDIIIAAPYWDLGFPAQLKTYIENIYVPGIVSAYNVYDDEMDEYVCEAYLDEDEFYRLMQTGKSCPYYRSGDDYELVRHQN